VAAGDDLGPECTGGGSGRHPAVLPKLLHGFGLGRLCEVATGPRGEHGADVEGIALPEQEVVGVVERYEALRVPRGLVDQGRVLDPDDGIDGRMEDQERPAERADGRLDPSTFEILEEIAARAAAWSTAAPPNECPISMAGAL
jgi:hypothetical protein